jgi:hypothetical protein
MNGDIGWRRNYGPGVQYFLVKVWSKGDGEMDEHAQDISFLK